MSEDGARMFTQDEVNKIVGDRVAAVKSAKDAEIAAMRDDLRSYSARAAERDALAQERDSLAQELSSLRTSAERSEVFAGVGVADAATRRRLEIIYAAETAGAEEAPAFADWIGTAKADPAFAAWFGSTAAPAPAPSVRAVPQTSANAGDPPAARRLAPADVLREHSSLLAAGKVKEAGEFLRQHASA